MVLREGESSSRAQAAAEFYSDPSVRSAARLAAACIDDPDELTRVAAAALFFRVSFDPAPAVRVLAKGTSSDDELVRAVSATALARIDPLNSALRALTRPAPAPRSGEATRTSMLIHGTWARSATWWQPGGSFHSYLLPWRPDLYAAADRFDWSGGYTPQARAYGASRLKKWIARHEEKGIALMTHSHGGSVAFLASWGGLRLGDLILLSCPVHAEYAPDFNSVGRVISVRVKWDLVILADGGGQKFDDSRITEVVLPVWFNHAATHTPDVWTKHGVAARIDAA